MKPEKRAKIKALLEDPATTPNEKEICRKLLKDNPEDLGREVTGREARNRMSGWATPRSQESGDFWRQAAAGQQDAAYVRAEQAAKRQRDAAWARGDTARDAEDRARGIHRGQSRSGRYPRAHQDSTFYKDPEVDRIKQRLKETLEQVKKDRSEFKELYGDFEILLEELRKKRDK